MIEHREWTPEEDALLLALWEQGMSGPRIAHRMGRPLGSIAGRRHRLKQQNKANDRSGLPAPRWTPEEDAELERAWAECGTLDSVAARLPGPGRAQPAFRAVERQWLEAPGAAPGDNAWPARPEQRRGQAQRRRASWCAGFLSHVRFHSLAISIPVYGEMLAWPRNVLNSFSPVSGGLSHEG